MKTVTRFLFVVALLSCVGCRGVVLSTDLSKELDTAVLTSAQYSTDASAGKLTQPQAVDALGWNAAEWKKFAPGTTGAKYNAAYTQIIGDDVTLTNEFSVRAKDGRLNQAECVKAVVWNAGAWSKFQAARDSKKTTTP